MFTTTSTARCNYSRNSRYLSVTGVFGGLVHSTTSPDPGSSGGLNEIREANSLSLNLEALVTRTSLALHPLYPPTGRGPTSYGRD